MLQKTPKHLYMLISTPCLKYTLHCLTLERWAFPYQPCFLIFPSDFDPLTPYALLLSIKNGHQFQGCYKDWFNIRKVPSTIIANFI